MYNTSNRMRHEKHLHSHHHFRHNCPWQCPTPITNILINNNKRTNTHTHISFVLDNQPPPPQPPSLFMVKVKIEKKGRKRVRNESKDHYSLNKDQLFPLCSLSFIIFVSVSHCLVCDSSLPIRLHSNRWKEQIVRAWEWKWIRINWTSSEQQW